MNTISISENVEDWKREGNLIKSGPLTIGHFQHEQDAQLLEDLVKAYLKALGAIDELQDELKTIGERNE